MISKGTRIGSGSLIGGWSMTGGKVIESNTIYGGCPCKRIKKNVFWRKPSCHRYTSIDTESNSVFNNNKFIYAYGKSTINFEQIDNKFDNLNSVDEKLNYILKVVQHNNNRNRFYIGGNDVFSKIIRILKDCKRKLINK